MNKYFAILAEDQTDCKAVQIIVRRILGKETKIQLWSSKGCAKLKRKLAAQLKSLSAKGCNLFIIVHDLDRNPQNNTLNNETELRQCLDIEASKVKGINKHICIPIEELEAWFWSDPEVIKYVGKGKGKAHPNPSQITQPKEQLIRISRGGNRKPCYSTNDNEKLAERLDLELCSRRCPSLRNLLKFIQS
ncbi:MAG: DUF4276 family protein [Microcystaceae cyanobacterium]